MRNYHVIGAMNRGGVSEIFRAVDLIDGRCVAIKRLLHVEETHLNEPLTEAMQREIRALSQLRHPSIVRLFKSGSDEQGPFLVLEMIEGESLEKVISEGALTYPDFFEIASQTLGALAAAEELRLLHRDLKPGNIMVTVNDAGQLVAKILDFGMSKFLDRPSSQTIDQGGNIIASVDYVAPEQIELQPLDPRADLYALGCIFYFCLSQTSPFRGGSPSTTIANHLEHKIEPLHKIRNDLPQIVCDWGMHLIERNPNDRPVGARHALTLLKKLADFEHVPGARLDDIDDFTAPLSSNSILHQTDMRVESHHLRPISPDLEMTETEEPSTQPIAVSLN